MEDLDGQVWLITGCDKGMGYAVANSILQRGGKVAATVLDSDGASSLAHKYGKSCKTYQLDVRDHARCAAVVAEAAADFGRIDVLLSNAGYGLIGAAEETDEAEYRNLFDVNFFGATEVIKATLPIMRSQRSGHIFCISSLVGFSGFPGFAFYSASKFAVEGYCEALAGEVSEFGVNVTIVEPGGFRTDFAGGSLAKTKVVIDAYKSSSGQVRAYMQARNGTQPGDPSRLGPALSQLVEMQYPPIRIQFGEDALEKVMAKITKTLEDCRSNEQLTGSTSVR